MHIRYPGAKKSPTLAARSSGQPGTSTSRRGRCGHNQRNFGWICRLITAPLLLMMISTASAWEPPSARRAELIRMVRDDCGSCHGMHLTGGLGPALDPDSLKEKPVERIAASISGGLSGTPMPPWQAFLSTEEARWIAEQLMRGFPR